MKRKFNLDEKVAVDKKEASQESFELSYSGEPY